MCAGNNQNISTHQCTEGSRTDTHMTYLHWQAVQESVVPTSELILPNKVTRIESVSSAALGILTDACREVKREATVPGVCRFSSA